MKYFGTQFEMAASIVAARRSIATYGSKSGVNEKLKLAGQFSRLVMQMVVSLLCLAGCFAVLFTSKDPAATKGAFGLLGVVVGYWLR